jgi:hypothetical protein
LQYQFYKAISRNVAAAAAAHAVTHCLFHFRFGDGDGQNATNQPPPPPPPPLLLLLLPPLLPCLTSCLLSRGVRGALVAHMLAFSLHAGIGPRSSRVWGFHYHGAFASQLPSEPPGPQHSNKFFHRLFSVRDSYEIALNG